eukprot:2682066-Heterocapsa_arctica.AAC.1
MLDVGKSSSFHGEFAQLEGTKLDEYRCAWLGQFELVEPKTLDAKVRAFKKWQSWAKGKTHPFAPSAVEVSSYLEQRRDGGPTAASGIAHAFAWVSRRYR